MPNPKKTNEKTQAISPRSIRRFILRASAEGVRCASCEDDLTENNTDLTIKQHGPRGASVRLSPYCSKCRRIYQSMARKSREWPTTGKLIKVKMKEEEK